MRTNAFFIMVFIAILGNTYGQEQEWTLGKSYKTTIDLTVNYIVGTTIKQRTAKAGLQYKYRGTIDDKVYIKFLSITKDTEETKDNDNFVNAKNDDIVYYVESSKLNNLHKQKTSSLVTGTMLAPIKVRPKESKNDIDYPWELSTDISLGQYLGYRFSLSKNNPYYITIPTITLGTSLLSINSSNSSPQADSSKTLGITGSLGIVIDFNGFNIGFLAGKDYAPGKAGQDWIYNEKVWYSVGFGINLTSKNKDL